jgi:ABC-type sugar transport system ATPase subunit
LGQLKNNLEVIMANIILTDLVKTFGKQTAVNKLTLDIKDKEFIAVLGPSGCGKSTTMNMISGLLKPDSGKIYFDDMEMNNVPPGERGIGFMFQNYAVFTHMTVYENIAFGLKIKSLPNSEIKDEVGKISKMLKVDHLFKYKAANLSVNDMQKVALARSMVTKPKIFLLDEPLSNLDTSLRNKMRAELKRIQKELGQTSIYVTHDQIEAMSLADRIAVMNFAELQQFDSPHKIYNHPKNIFVANFIGSPTINFLRGEYESGEILMQDFENGKIVLSKKHKNQLDKLIKQKKIIVGIRPEHLKIRHGDIKDSGALKTSVTSTEPLGSKVIVYMKNGEDNDNLVKSSITDGYIPKVIEKVSLSFKEKDLYLFDESTTELILRLS